MINHLKITIEQLDRMGNVYRVFNLYPRTDADLARKLDNIEQAYNLDRTDVTIWEGTKGTLWNAARV